jgi:hypothetical protein
MASEPITLTLTLEQYEVLVAIVGDAVAYRDNSGEGAEDEYDIEKVAEYEAFADQFGITVY